jgi:uncharacterized protein YdhG (YjbR/CyaY superfamily)
MGVLWKIMQHSGMHIGFFPTPSAIAAFKKDLSGNKTTKGTIKFPLDKPIPYDLIERIVKFRINEVKQNEINCYD